MLQFVLILPIIASNLGSKFFMGYMKYWDPRGGGLKVQQKNIRKMFKKKKGKRYKHLLIILQFVYILSNHCQ